MALKHVLEKVEKLKADGDLAATLLSNYMHESEEEYEILQCLTSAVWERMDDEDEDFVYEFLPKLRKMAIYYLFGSTEYALSKLKKDLESM